MTTSKRILSAIAAICLVFFAISSFRPVRLGARAATDLGEITKITGHEYELQYLLENAGLEVLEEKTNVTEGRFVRYRIAEKGGAPVEENAEGVKNSAFAAATRSSKIEFFSEGKYLFEVYLGAASSGDANAPDAEAQLEATFTVATVAETEENSVVYDASDEARAAYNELLETAKKDLAIGDSITLPSFEKIVSSPYFAYSDLTKTVYYTAPQSTSYTSTSGTKFKLTAPGTYSFYVLVTDPCKNATTVEDLVEGEKGWYKKDEDGNRVGEVVVPVFTFTVDKVTVPKISVETSENGFLNLEYKIDCFTVDAVDYETEYKLFYSATEQVKESDYAGNYDEFSKALIKLADENAMEDVTEELLNTDTMRFTPAKKGFYYVYIRAVDSNNLSEEVMSRPIVVEREFTAVKLENMFFRNNIFSIVCFGVSLVCFIAIIIIVVSGAAQNRKSKPKQK